jgi:curved DNA-binding protein CbpA
VNYEKNKSNSGVTYSTHQYHHHMTCPFRILKLPTTATEREIIKKWKQLVFQTHPDKHEYGQATEQTKVLNDAKERAIEIYRLETEEKRKQSEISRIFTTFMRKHRFDSDNAAYGMAEAINKLNEEMSIVKEDTGKLESLLREEVERGRKMKRNAEEDAEILENLLREEIELGKKMKDSYERQLADTVENMEKEQTRDLKKRKGVMPETDAEIAVKAFVSSHIILCPGHFSTTHEFYKAFLENCNATNQQGICSNRFFQIFKDVMLDLYANQSCFSYVRTRQGRERTRGYLGVALSTLPR